MKYYIATKLERHADHNLVRDAMANQGHEITYDWTHHGPVWRDGPARIREVALLETRGVLDADIVIVLLPGGRGTHAELGMALAAGIPVLLHSADPGLYEGPETCAFYHHPLCLQSRLPSLGELPTVAEFAREYLPAAARPVRREEPDYELVERCKRHVRRLPEAYLEDFENLLELVAFLEADSEALHAEIDRLSPPPTAETSPAVQRAMDRFHAKLAELQAGRLQEDDGEAG